MGGRYALYLYLLSKTHGLQFPELLHPKLQIPSGLNLTCAAVSGSDKSAMTVDQDYMSQVRSGHWDQQGLVGQWEQSLHHWGLEHKHGRVRSSTL